MPIRVVKNNKEYSGYNGLRLLAIEQNKRNTNITKEAIDFLNGELLGDGHLQLLSNNTALYRHWSKHKPYLEWLSAILASFGIEQGGNITSRVEYKTNNKKGEIRKNIAYQYTSKAYKLKELYDKWYLHDFSFCPFCEIIFHDQTVNLKEWENKKCPICSEHKLKKKTVPKDIELTPVTLRQWYIGDGSIRNYIYDDVVPLSITIHAKSLLCQDYKLLSDKLKLLDFNIEYKINEGFYFETNVAIKFLNYLGKCPVNCYKYKFRYRKTILLKR